jgi:16S rRNA (uracil1498-N3)-methyltransferase
MRIPRIFYPFELEEKNSINLDISSSHHLNVINIKLEQEVELFNGEGDSFKAKVLEKNKKNISLEKISEIKSKKKQIPSINIAVAEIKSFDKVVRESCQLGVNSINSLMTKRTKSSNLAGEKKIQRWKVIASNSCEQCGLNWVPDIKSSSLEDWISSSKSKNKIFLDPKSHNKIQKLNFLPSIDLAVGPEGGFTEDEKDLFKKNNFKSISCGNLIFKTETMPIVALSMIQALYGEKKL